MRIKTRIKLGIILSLVLAVTIALLIFLAARTVNETNRLEGIASEAVKGVAEMKIITHEYLLHPEERSLMQWRSKYDSLSKHLTVGHFKNPDEKIAADQIFKNLERFKTVFSALITGLRKGETPGNQESSAFRELQDRLMGELLVKSQLAVSLAFQLHQNIDAKSVTTQKRFSFLTLLLLLILTVAIIGILLWVNRSIARPIAKLERDTQTIGSGNLDHKVGTPAKDEIGELSRAFDKMTQDLKETTTSIVELNKEIDERKQAQKTVREEKEFSESLIDTAQVIILVLDTEGRIVRFNPYMEDLCGYKLDEIQGKDWFSTFLSDQDYEHIRTLFLQAVGNMQTRGNINPIIAKDGSEILIEWHDKTLKDGAGNTIGLLAMGQDITSRKQSEEALKESEEKYRLLVEHQTDLLVKVDREGRFQFVSPSYCRMFDKTEEELLGKTFMPLVHPDDQKSTAKEMEKLYYPPHTAYIEQRAKTKEGWKWFAWLDTAVLDEKGDVTEIIGLGRDISDKKQAEIEKERLQSQLQQSQKMEAVGTLSGGIAHDFNNILTIILGNAELAFDDVPEGNPATENLEKIRQASYQGKRNGPAIAFFQPKKRPEKSASESGSNHKRIYENAQDRHSHQRGVQCENSR